MPDDLARLSMYFEMMEAESYNRQEIERQCYQDIDLSIREAMIDKTYTPIRYTKYHEPVIDAVSRLYTHFPQRKLSVKSLLQCPGIYVAGKLFCEPSRKENVTDSLMLTIQRLTLAPDAWDLANMMLIRFSETIDPKGKLAVFASAQALTHCQQKKRYDSELMYVIERVAQEYGDMAPGFLQNINNLKKS